MQTNDRNEVTHGASLATEEQRYTENRQTHETIPGEAGRGSLSGPVHSAPTAGGSAGLHSFFNFPISRRSMLDAYTLAHRPPRREVSGTTLLKLANHLI